MNLQVTLPTSQEGLVLKNLTTSMTGTSGYVIGCEKIMSLNRFGVIVPNSMTLTDGQSSTAKRFCQSDCGFISSLGTNNLSYKTFTRDTLPHLPYETTPVFIDIKAYDMGELCEFVSTLSEVPELVGTETNLNCPYGNFAVSPYWKDEEKLREMIRRVKAAAGNKILWFETPAAEYPAQQMVAAAQESDRGASISFNAIGGYSMDIEIRRFRYGSRGSGGYSDPGVKPYAMICAHNSSKATKIPVTGEGGIVCVRDVLEYTMIGVHTARIDSTNLTRPDFMERLVEELEELTDKMNVESLDGIRGCAEYA